MKKSKVEEEAIDTSRQSTTLSDIPKDVIFLIANNLDIQSVARLSHSSRFFKNLNLVEKIREKELAKAFDTLIFNTLNSLNHHDLFNLALKQEFVALIVLSTPSLAKKLNQPLYGDRLKETQLYYVEGQYEESNCFYKEERELYNLDIPDPIYALAKEHSSVAQMLSSEDYDVIDLDNNLKQEIQEMVQEPKKVASPTRDS